MAGVSRVIETVPEADVQVTLEGFLAVALFPYLLGRGVFPILLTRPS